MQPHLSDHLQSIVMTWLTIKNKVHDLESVTNLLQQALDVLLDKTERWADLSLRNIGTRLVGKSHSIEAIHVWYRTCVCT